MSLILYVHVIERLLDTWLLSNGTGMLTQACPAAALPSAVFPTCPPALQGCSVTKETHSNESAWPVLVI